MKKDSLTIALLLVVMWFSHMLLDFMIGIWAVYKTIAGLDIAIAGLIAGASALIGESLQGVFGPLADKGYRQKLVVCGLLLTTASAFMAYTDNYFLLFICFLFTCIGSGAFHPSAVSVINEMSDSRKALFMTIFQSGGSIGLACSQLVFSKAYFMLEGHTIYLAIPTLLLIVLIVVKGFGGQKMTADVVHKKTSWKTFGRFFKSRALSSLYFTQLCNQSIFWATVFLLPDVLVARGYDDWICFGGAHLFLILGGAFMMVPAGYFADRYSCKNVIFTATALALVAFYIFLVSPTMTPVLLCVTLFTLGAALGTVSPVVVALGNRLSPGNSGAISAFLMGLVWCVAEGIGQGGGGMLTKLFSEQAATYSLGCLGLLFIVGLGTCMLLPKVETDLKLEIA